MKPTPEVKRLVDRVAMAERSLAKTRKDVELALEYAYRASATLFRQDGSESEAEEAHAAVAALTTMAGFLRRADEAHADAKLHSGFLIGE